MAAGTLLIATLLVGGPSGAARPTHRSAVAGHSASARLDGTTPPPYQTLYGWGENDFGELGTGVAGPGYPSPTPTGATVTSPSGTPYAQVAAGGAFTVGLDTAGNVSSWGDGTEGELGDGSENASDVPVAVTVPGSPVLQVAAGSSFALALTQAGAVYAWGANVFGQLGDGSTSTADAPVLVQFPAGTVITQIAAGGGHALALDDAGNLWAWGDDANGELGDGSTTSSDVPVEVTAPTGGAVTWSQQPGSIAAGDAHSVALTTTGAAYSWGSNASGQLGDFESGEAAFQPDSPVPVAVAAPAGGAVAYQSVAAGASYTVALTTSGQVETWGSDVFGQLAQPTGASSYPPDSDQPVQPLALPTQTTYVAVAAGADAAYALTVNGVEWGWGGDFLDQLGADAAGSEQVTKVSPEALLTVPSDAEAAAIFAGPDSGSAFLLTRALLPITFPTPPALSYGDAPVDLQPTDGAGVALATSVSSVPSTASTCAGSADHVVVLNVGTCTVSATATGTTAYYASAQSVTFTIAPAPLTVTPRPATMLAGQPVPTLGYTFAGFKNHDGPTSLNGAPSCTTTATSRSAPGAYPITCTAGTISDGNYTFVAGPPATLTVLGPSNNYAVVSKAGDVYAGGATSTPFYGSLLGDPLAAPIVGASFSPLHHGYWLVASDGGVFAFGDARFLGSMGGRPLNRPIVGMTSTPDGGGYWLVASDGGIFSYGDARYFGSMGGKPLNQPIVGMAATSDGGGYWLVASDGGIFSFGDARFYGSTGGDGLQSPVVGMATDPVAGGYWLTTASGLVFPFGSAAFHGDLLYLQISSPIVGIAPTSDGNGYWLAGQAGGVYTFGDAGFYGVPTAPGSPEVAII